MEKHIIFLYPLHPVIQELKDILEEDGSYDINEIDDANEYRQLVGIIGNCITFTSDVRKIQSTIDAQAQLIKNGVSKVVLMGRFQNFQQEIGQLRVLGVQEILPETTPLKSLQFKLNLFLKSFENAEAQKEKDKIKEDQEFRKKEAKKHVPLVVDNSEDKSSLIKKRPLPEHASSFDFKGFVKSAITPFSVKPVDEKKKKSKYSPFRVDQEASEESLRKTSKGIVFDEVEEEESTSKKKDETKKDKKKGYKSGGIEFDEAPVDKKEALRLAKVEEKRLKMAELEEAAAAIKKNREALRLTQEKENRESSKKEDDKKNKRKKYNPFHVGKAGSEKEELEDEEFEDDEESDESSDSKGIYKKNQGGMSLIAAEELGEQTIDYSEFAEEDKVIDEGYIPEAEKKKTYLEEDNELTHNYPEFYFPPSGISIYIPLFLEVLQARPFDQAKFMNFLCFVFRRKLQGHLTYIIEREDQVELLSSSYLVEDKSWDWESVYTSEKMKELREKVSPTWSDETFQDEIIEFVFPFYFNKQRMGLAHAVFNRGEVNSIQEALEIELLIVMARTVYLKEFRF